MGKPAIDIQDIERREVSRVDWNRVHIEGDRNPPIKIWPRRWRFTGEGTRRQKGGFAA